MVVAWWPNKAPAAEGGQGRPGTAKVIQSAPCGASTRGDLVEVKVDGKPRQARFDGCGHAQGQQLQVLVPADPGTDFKVQPADAGTTSASGENHSRLNWVLLTLSGVAGGGYALLLRPRRSS